MRRSHFGCVVDASGAVVELPVLAVQPGSPIMPPTLDRLLDPARLCGEHGRTR